jgi:hypothetical protein
MPHQPLTMIVSFISRGKRTGAYLTIRKDDLRYLLIEADGEVLYDSRNEVPCNMAKWDATPARFCNDRPLKNFSYPDGVRR